MTRLSKLTFLVLGLTSLSCKQVYQPSTTSDEFRDQFNFYIVNHVKELAESRAPAEFECRQSEMTFKALGKADRVRVTGCGKKATYHFVQNVGWVLNTDIEPDEG